MTQFLIFSFYILNTSTRQWKKTLIKIQDLWNGSRMELAQKDLSELIERLKNVEGDDTSSELSRLGTKSNTIN